MRERKESEATFSEEDLELLEGRARFARKRREESEAKAQAANNKIDRVLGRER